PPAWRPGGRSGRRRRCATRRAGTGCLERRTHRARETHVALALRARHEVVLEGHALRAGHPPRDVALGELRLVDELMASFLGHAALPRAFVAAIPAISVGGTARA